ncbi:hypothetical protein [Trichloromonas sp.]|uniref:hypothetical protein n=1 Tax=Trichloromonas sp. TaxID=3069249 RepID=UPI003D812878
MKKYFKFLMLVLVTLLAGCGSGGGGSDGTSGGTGTVDTTVADVNAIALSARSSTIKAGETTAITVKLLTASGQFVTDSKTVSFSFDNPALASIVPKATTVSGTLSVNLTAGSNQGDVTLTATVDGVSDSLTIQISDLKAATKVTVASIPDSITIGGTSVVSATVLDSNDDPMAAGTVVNFSVNNIKLGTIVPSATISGNAGVAVATFSAGSSSAGIATVTATSGSASGTTDIAVAGAAAGSIEFVSATPQVVVIKGAGGQETSIVKFLVKDSNGNPVNGSQTVVFKLSGPNGGEYIGTTPGVTELEVGTLSGVATVILHSGAVPGTSTIIATVKDTALSTSSGVIAIGGGVPSAGHFSLATTKLNLEGGNYDGITAEITARMADRYGNYNVLAGTAVSFYSECGAIDRATNLSAAGEGSVTFRTQRPDPENVLSNTVDDAYKAKFFTDLGIAIPATVEPRDGLCTIVAVVDGEEEFTDANANGRYDLGEAFDDTYDDIHLDKDDDREDIAKGAEIPGNPYDNTFEDLVVDRNLNGLFNGMNGEWDSNKRISRQIKLLFTGRPGISVSTSNIDIPNPGATTIFFSIHDSNYNPPIAGTEFKVATDVGALSGKTKNTFMDTNAPGAPIYSVTIANNNTDKAADKLGSLTFTWTWKGGEYTESIPVRLEKAP